MQVFGLILSCVFAITLNAKSALAHTPSETFSNFNEFQAKHYEFDLRVDFNQKTIDGSVEITFNRILASAKQVILDTENLEIQNVQVDGKSSRYTLLNTAENLKEANVGQALQISVPNDKTQFKVKITYKNSPKASGLIWMDAHQTTGGYPILFALNEPIGARSWLPSQDTPAIRSTFAGKIETVIDQQKFPDPIRVLTSATNPGQGQTFTKSEPVPVYLFVLAAGRFQYRKIDENFGFFSDNTAKLDQAERGFKKLLPQYFSFLTEKLGPSPWQKHNFLLVPSMFGYGGMENPGLIYINEAIVDDRGSNANVLAHELAHQWTGNVVTNVDWGNFWLNEGWTTYWDFRAEEKVYGLETAENGMFFFSQDRLDPKLPLFQPVKENAHPESVMNHDVYARGALFLRNLELKVGRESFDAFAKDYIRLNRGKTISTESFLQFVSKRFPSVDSAWLNTWIYEPRLPAETIFFQCPQCTASLTALRNQPNAETIHSISQADPFVLAAVIKELKAESFDSQERNHLVASLLNSPSFIASVEKFVEVESNWYELVLMTPHWQSIDQNIAQFLTQQGRGLYIKPIYRKMFNSSNDDMLNFARSNYSKNQDRYFSTIRNAINSFAK